MDKNAERNIIIRKVFTRIRLYGWMMVTSLMMAAVSVGMALYIPILAGQAIDQIIAAGKVNFHGLGGSLAGIGLCTVISAVAQWVMSLLNERVTCKVSRDIRNEAFSHLQRLPLKYLDGHPHGDLVSRVVADVDTFADGLLMGFSQFFTGVITILGTLILMLMINWRVALVVICVTPLSLVLADCIAKRTYHMFQVQTKTKGEQTALIHETLEQIKTVKAFGHEQASAQQFQQVNERLRQSSLKAIFFSSLVNPSTRFVNALVYAGVALVGGFMVLEQSLTVGALTSFLSYSNQYTKPFNEISGVITELQNALACAGRVFALIEEPGITESENTDTPAIYGNVKIEDLAFSYHEDQPLIRDMELSVDAGQRIAIVGPTGCGKTTFINLLMRFYEPNAGAICLDGVDIRQMERSYLRKNVGMVLQDTWLKAGTIRENIAMGRPGATDEQIREVAKLAHAHSFIKRLPQGYDTVIGENGGSLSQGQKQLLCIARVMLCLPPMLFLDEATSSIDTRTEAKIQKAFDTMMQGRTSFIVAHRLSTIQEADLILVMRDGRIVEQGKHKELLEKQGFYHQLYHSQFAH